MSTPSEIAGFYSNKSVLITGATGFLGKVLLEILLRSCPDLKCAYVLIRNLREKNPSLRLDELLNSQAFDRLRCENPEALSKVVPIPGDTTLPGLGLSPADEELLASEVSIVFNLAARLKFDEQLKEAIDSNVNSALELVRISRAFKKLQVFVHVSTAFCHYNDVLVEETIPSAEYDATELLNLIASMGDDEYKSFVKNLMSKHHNVYGFTKGLVEQLLEKESRKGFPLVIVKPSTVTAAVRDPYPGWIDSWNGINGLVAGLGKGLIQVYRLDRSNLNDVVPVDYCANITLAAAWNYASKREKTGDDKLQVYNYCSGSSNPLTFGQSVDYAVESWRDNPASEFVWYPSCACYRTWLPYFFSILFYHCIPAFLIDFLTRASGKRPFLMRLYKKLHRLMDVMLPYTLLQWNFKADNQVKLLDQMSPADRVMFDFDTSKLDWRKFVELCCLGIRTYVFKEDTATLNRARKLAKRKYAVQFLFRAALYVLALSCVIFGLQQVGLTLNVSSFLG